MAPTHQEESGNEQHSEKEESSSDDRKDRAKVGKIGEERKPKPSGKKHSRKKKPVQAQPEDNESAVLSDADKEDQPPKPKDRPNNPWVRRRTVSQQHLKSNESPNIRKTAQTKSPKISDETADETEDKPTTNVKQFSFPHYKILSGATVAAVKMRPQKLVVRRTIDETDENRHWAVGLFQPTKLSLKLRLLRLFLVWLFFRVLNKQTGWLSDKLSIGMLDEPPPPPPPRSKDPSERYIKVFHESSPHPIHVRVRKPPS